MARSFLSTKYTSTNSNNTSFCHLTPRIWRLGIFVAILLLMASGCGTLHIATGTKAVLPAEKVRVAILPLENLTKHQNAGVIGAELLVSEVRSRGRFDIVPFGEVLRAMENLEILHADRMKNVTADKIGQAVAADLLIIGSVSEYGYQFGLREEPSVSMNLRLVQMNDGDVLWAHSAGVVGRGVFGRDSVSMSAQSLVKRMIDALLEP
jgi:hypothetical protein